MPLKSIIVVIVIAKIMSYITVYSRKSFNKFNVTQNYSSQNENISELVTLFVFSQKEDILAVWRNRKRAEDKTPESRTVLPKRGQLATLISYNQFLNVILNNCLNLFESLLY